LEDRIFIRHNDKMVKVMFADILHVAADRSYCRIITTKKEYLLSMPMKRLEEKLPAANFCRTHRSHIVNLLQVDEISDGMVRMGKELLPLSPAMKGDFMRRLNAVWELVSQYFRHGAEEKLRSSPITPKKLLVFSYEFPWYRNPYDTLTDTAEVGYNTNQSSKK